MIARRRRPGDPIVTSAPTRMRPVGYWDKPDGTTAPHHYVAVASRNGLPVGRYRWRQATSCSAAALPCQRCELARGCGGLFDRAVMLGLGRAS